MTRTEKIGTVEILEVHRSGRRTYVNLDSYTVSTYAIQPGDRLRVKIEAVIRSEEPKQLSEPIPFERKR